MRAWCLGLATSVVLLGSLEARAVDDVMVVFDGSNSMWGQIDGVSKIEIARDAMGELVADWADGIDVGLMAYGHRRQGDCADIETIIEPGPLDRERFLAHVRAIVPRGKTPLTASIEKAAEQLAWRDRPSTVILISDGIESCNRDPCALADELERSGVAFTAHVIGFDLADEAEQKALACIAERTGGRFLTAGNAGELGAALKTLSSAVATPDPVEPAVVEEPAVEATIEVDAPPTARVGSRLEVRWSKTLDERDYLTIVPADAKPEETANYARAGKKQAAMLRAPAEPGLYEVRYVLAKGHKVMGRTAIEIEGVEVALQAPRTAVAGSVLEASWEPTIDGSDYITIVPVGSAANKLGNYKRAGSGSSAKIQVPAETGLYEVRYVLEEGRRVLGAAGLEIVEATVSVSAPETVLAGSAFEVTSSTTIKSSDYITIVPVGSAPNEIGNYVRAGKGGPVTLRAPAEAGLYEVRYVLEEGRRMLASATVEVGEAEMLVKAPKTAIAGSAFEVSWSAMVHPSDYVTIVPVDAAEDEIGNYVRAGTKNAGMLQAPAGPGMYQVRYVLQEGRRLLAETMVEIVAPEIALEATATVRAKGTIEVSWTGTQPSPQDYITLVPMGAKEGELGKYARAGKGGSATLPAPEQVGLYEVRYVLAEGRGTIASAEVEVVEENAPLDSGASLDVPNTASPGEIVQVTWSVDAEGANQRITLATPDQADFTWIEAHKVDNESPMRFTMPEAPGFYEFRYLDIGARKVLARAIVEVR
ncbi:VWA domain-containing protein [Geminicoccaceae bacterium 1502E]|nr:VWA domain-containing protein [Geminicoccaceae bacterium 1502E]